MKPWQVLKAVTVLLYASAEASHDLNERASDDLACRFDSNTHSCAPEGDCVFQFEFGDLTPNQSCRVNKERVAFIPQQIHLAFAGKPTGTGMVVSWTTYDRADDAQVWLGSSTNDLSNFLRLRTTTSQ